MMALDTNVLVRYLARDNIDQFNIANELINSCTADRPGYVCREVMIELVWVLERSYKYSRKVIANALESIVSASQLEVESAQDIAAVLNLYRKERYDFADLLIWKAALRGGNYNVKTFDQKFAKLDGVDLL